MKSDTPLNRERILLAAIKLADDTEISKLTMRSLAKAFGVTPMSLYRYYPNKDALLHQMLDEVFNKIYRPVVGNPWRKEMFENAHSVRRVLLEHTWALSLIESRADPGPATLAHHDALIGTLCAAGFEMALVAQAFSTLDAYVYGFVLQEITLPFDANEEQHETIQASVEQAPDDGAYPHLMALATQHFAQPGYNFGDQFDFGLNLILDGLEKHAL